MDAKEYRAYIQGLLKEKLDEIDLYRREYLELTKRQIQLVIDWTTTLSTLCFAIGAAVIPLISQFTGNKVKHPALLFTAAAILIANGTVILILKKHRMQQEARQTNVIISPHEISLTKTIAVLSDLLRGNTTKADVDKRLDEQLAEAEAIAKMPRQEDKPSFELDAYLGVMLAGIFCLFGSIVSSHKSMVLYVTLVIVASVSFVVYAGWSYKGNKANVKLKADYDKKLRDASSYKVTS